MKKSVILVTLILLLPHAQLGAVEGSVSISSPPPRKMTSSELVEALQVEVPMTFRGIESRPVEPKVMLDIKFEFNSDLLTDKSVEQLLELGDALQSEELSLSRFAIVGHTDGAGGHEYNQALSVSRAQAVKEFLVSNHDISSRRLYTSGRGEMELLIPNDPENPLNRRVEIKNLGP